MLNLLAKGEKCMGAIKDFLLDMMSVDGQIDYRKYKLENEPEYAYAALSAFPEEFQLTDFDEELSKFLKKILEVPFDKLKPIICNQVDKYFPTKEELEKCYEKDVRKKNLTPDNTFVKFIEESLGREVDRPMLYDVLESLALLDSAYTHYVDAELISNQYDEYRSCGYSGYDDKKVDEDAISAREDYLYRKDVHNKLVLKFTESLFPPDKGIDNLIL